MSAFFFRFIKALNLSLGVEGILDLFLFLDWTSVDLASFDRFIHVKSPFGACNL